MEKPMVELFSDYLGGKNMTLLLALMKVKSIFLALQSGMKNPYALCSNNSSLILMI